MLEENTVSTEKIEETVRWERRTRDQAGTPPDLSYLALSEAGEAFAFPLCFAVLVGGTCGVNGLIR